MVYDYTKLPKNRKSTKAINSVGQELYFPMKVKSETQEQYSGNIINASDNKHKAFTDLKYTSNELINIFGIPEFNTHDILGKQILEWKFKMQFENTKVSSEYQHGAFIISTSKIITENDESSKLLKTLKNLNINEHSHEHCHEDVEYIPLDSNSKWTLEIYFNKFPYELLDKYAMNKQSKIIIDFIESRNLNENLCKLKI